MIMIDVPKKKMLCMTGGADGGGGSGGGGASGWRSFEHELRSRQVALLCYIRMFVFV